MGGGPLASGQIEIVEGAAIVEGYGGKARGRKVKAVVAIASAAVCSQAYPAALFIGQALGLVAGRRPEVRPGEIGAACRGPMILDDPQQAPGAGQVVMEIVDAMGVWLQHVTPLSAGAVDQDRQVAMGFVIGTRGQLAPRIFNPGHDIGHDPFSLQVPQQHVITLLIEGKALLAGIAVG